MTFNIADRETDGADHWKSMSPKRRHAFKNESGYTSSDSDWLGCVCQRSKKKISMMQELQRRSLFFRDFQGHSRGELIALERKNQVAIPLRRKEFLYHRCHRGSSWNVTSVLQAGLIADSMGKKAGRHTLFFTP